MSEALDQETKRHSNYLSQLLTIATQVADKDRTERLKGTHPEGQSYIAIAGGNLTVRIFQQRPNRYLIVAYKSAGNDGRVVYLPHLLEHAHAWILRYDSQHARWSVEASNFDLGNKSFLQLANHLFPKQTPK